MLDSLLIVRGESAREFEWGIGVDLPQPAAVALELLQPKFVRQSESLPPKLASGWFFHLGAKNIVATWWEPIVATSSTADHPAGTIQGVRARLLEIAGTPGRVPLRLFRSAAAARQVDFVGETILELAVDNDKIMLDFGAFEFIEIEILWQR